MKIKKLILSLTLILTLFFSICPYNVKADEKIYLGGMPAGFSMNMEGATIVGFSDVLTDKGLKSPSKEGGIIINDILLAIDDKIIDNAVDIEKSIKNKDEIIVKIKRNEEILYKTIYPSKDLSGNYKLGIFVRNDICGIGTITFIKGNKFASLGHPVLDDNDKIINIKDGTLFNCSITGLIKGQRGKAGELRGVFLKTNPIGIIEKNTENGVYGQITRDFDSSDLTTVEIGDPVVGEANVYSTIIGNTPEKYEIMIVKNETFSKNKNFVIKITDKNLLNKTNGIVQGMSGSPIVQNGKLIGAVTHVFINDPTRGFGISINNMTCNID